VYIRVQQNTELELAITIKNLQKKLRISPKKIKKAILNTLKAEGVKEPCRINVCFTGDKEIKKLNYRYLKIKQPTDVLAFDMSAGPGRGGIQAEIIVSTDTAARNAAVFGTLPMYEACLYVLHGVLHILGYNDATVAAKKQMQRKAELILSCL